MIIHHQTARCPLRISEILVLLGRGREENVGPARCCRGPPVPRPVLPPSSLSASGASGRSAASCGAVRSGGRTPALPPFRGMNSTPAASSAATRLADIQPRPPGCVIPGFDGVILAMEGKAALGGGLVLAAPRPGTPSAQPRKDRKLRSRSRRREPGIDPKTLAQVAQASDPRGHEDRTEGARDRRC